MGGRSSITEKSYKDKGFEPSSLVKHYNWHNDEFENITIHEYNKLAIKFKNSKGRNIQEYFRKDNKRARYNKTTNEFIVIKPGGEIVTYYNPTSINYYERDKKKYE
jgi:pyocin large subunit-like protein